MRNKTGEQRKA